MTTYGVYPEPRRRVGQHYEKKGTTVTKYYFAGATRLAVRTGGTLSYLLGDHLGSSSVTTNASGVKTASALYKAFGETRYTLGNLGTDYKFTGQREQAELGLYFYGARWFDPSLGRFTSPDTIVPTGTQGTQAWDRYAYVNNNPVRYTDPTGHMIENEEGESNYEQDRKSEDNQSEDDPCDEHGCWLVMDAFTEADLLEMQETFEELAATDDGLAWLFGIAVMYRFGKSGTIPAGLGGLAISEMSDARDKVADFFNKAADAAHNADDKELVIGLYQLREVDNMNREPGFYLVMPGASPQRVEGWQIVDLLWQLTTH